MQWSAVEWSGVQWGGALREICRGVWWGTSMHQPVIRTDGGLTRFLPSSPRAVPLFSEGEVYITRSILLIRVCVCGRLPKFKSPRQLSI